MNQVRIPPTSEPGSTGKAPDRSQSANWFLTTLTVIGFALPLTVYLLLIHALGVNLTWRDQWSDVQIIRDSYSGHLTLGQLWSLHNENRIFFPNLIVLLLSRTTHFNVVIEEYIGAALLLASIALILLAHRRRLGPISLLFYCPVVILMLTLVQYQNTLWGFQLAWYLVLACFALALLLLDREILSGPIVALAIASGIVGSFSSLQGLIIWPAGLILLLCRHRPRAVIATWVLSAWVTTVVYFIGFGGEAGAISYTLHHPLASVTFYLVLVGDVLGSNVTHTGGSTHGVELFGLIVLACSVWAVVAYCRGRIAPSGGALAVTMICFGWLFALFVTASRSVAGISAAGQSRYRTFDLLIVVGLYLLATEEFIRRRTTGSNCGNPTTNVGRKDSAVAMRGSNRFFMGIVVVLVFIQIVVGSPEGLAGARSYHGNQVQGARVLANISRYPDSFVESTLGILQSADFIRRMAAVLEQHRLTIFANDAAARYRAEGPLVLPRANLRVVIPRANSIVSGKQYLGLSISDVFKITDARFEATGEGFDQVTVSRALPYEYGWIGVWTTTGFPDGHYELQAVASDSRGHRLRSAEVAVTIRN